MVYLSIVTRLGSGHSQYDSFPFYRPISLPQGNPVLYPPPPPPPPAAYQRQTMAPYIWGDLVHGARPPC